MTKKEAVLTVMKEARSERRWTDTSVARVVKALKVLEIRGAEQRQVLAWLEILDGELLPWKKDLKVVWDTEDGLW